MLTIRGIEAGYGTIKVLKKLDLDVEKGEIVTLIGANGAGKTTMLRVISGLLAPRKGEITFENKRITGLPPHKTLRRGICLVPEGREILSDMTVLENLLMGGFIRRRAEVNSSVAAVFELFPILRERQTQLGKTLSGGEQQMLAIGRALMSKPKLLMMDEPSLGLAPMLVNEVFLKIRELRSADVDILLVEQNARKALKIADRGYVLETGQIVLSGTGRELISNEKIHAAYLGGKAG